MVKVYLPYEIKVKNQILDRYKTKTQAVRAFGLLKKRGSAYKSMRIIKLKA